MDFCLIEFSVMQCLNKLANEVIFNNTSAERTIIVTTEVPVWSLFIEKKKFVLRALEIQKEWNKGKEANIMPQDSKYS